MKNLIILILACSTGIIFAQNQPPQISNLTLTLNGNESLSIQYDLSDAENDEAVVSLHVKKSDGITFSIDTQNATGDLNMVSPGTGKTIEWDFTGTLMTSGDYIVKLVAEDMALIDIQSIVDQVDSNNLKTELAIIEGIRHRIADENHLQATRNLIEQRFLDYGLNVTIQDFNFGAYTGQNYIGTKAGTTDDEFIYICDAHYDSEPNTPGADDNGSGVVGVLEVAKILSNYNFKKTIKFIGFDLEEAGLKGSLAYVQNNISPEEEISGVLNFEMIGYYTEIPNTQTLPTGFNLLFPDVYAAVEGNSFKGNFIANIGLVNQNGWELAYDNAATTYVPNLNIITFTAPQNWATLTPDLGRSDHAPFWLSDHPAVMITGTSEFRNANYHTPNDTLGSLNFTFMANVVKAAVATLAEEAEIHNSSFEEETINIMITSLNETNPCTVALTPNPTSDFLSFNLTNCNMRHSSVSIYDLTGKEVFNKKASLLDFKLNVKDWANGIYIFKAGEFSKKFMVQH